MAYVVHLKNVLPLKLLYIKRKRSTITLLEGTVSYSWRLQSLAESKHISFWWKLCWGWSGRSWVSGPQTRSKFWQQHICTFLIVIYRNTFISITADLRNRVHHCSSSFGDSYKTWSGFPKVHYNWAWRTLGDKSFVCQSGSKWVLIRAAIHKKFVSRLGSQWALIRVPDCKNFTGQLGCQCALMRPYDRNKFISQLGCQWALLKAPKSQ